MILSSLRCGLGYFGVLWLIMLISLSSARAGENSVQVLTVADAIGPATADYIEKGLREADKNNAALVVLALDTPGGLDSAMREIIQDIIASPVPVATFVSPSGARAASAGTYILYASHLAVMAPGTNLGAATPVQIGGLPGLTPDKNQEKKPKSEQEETEQAPGEDGKAGDGAEENAESSGSSAKGDAMSRKMMNDAAAYLRALAQMNGRNEQWAGEAVRESASLSADEALEKGVIDLIAHDLRDLLRKLQGREVKVLGTPRTLDTEHLVVEKFQPDWRNKLLAVLSNPNMAYILLLLGIYGLFFELYNPGSVFPGVIGGISLLLALFAFQILPVNYAGLALILLGLAFMVAEAFLPSFGILGLGGVVAFVFGSVILLDSGSPYYEISRSLIAGLAIFSVAFLLMVLNMFARIRDKPVVSGKESLIGREAKCVHSSGEALRVLLNGEYWWARSDSSILPDQHVRVVGINGLTLQVEPLGGNEHGSTLSHK